MRSTGALNLSRSCQRAVPLAAVVAEACQFPAGPVTMVVTNGPTYKLRQSAASSASGRWLRADTTLPFSRRRLLVERRGARARWPIGRRNAVDVFSPPMRAFRPEWILFAAYTGLVRLCLGSGHGQTGRRADE